MVNFIQFENTNFPLMPFAHFHDEQISLMLTGLFVLEEPLNIGIEFVDAYCWVRLWEELLQVDKLIQSEAFVQFDYGEDCLHTILGDFVHAFGDKLGLVLDAFCGV